MPRETAGGVKVGSGDQVFLPGTMISTSPSQQACSLPSDGKSRLALKAGGSEGPDTVGDGCLWLKHVMQRNGEEPWGLAPWTTGRAPWTTLDKLP